MGGRCSFSWASVPDLLRLSRRRSEFSLMGFTLYNIFKAGLLIANGVAVLHPKRFLAKHGFDQVDTSGDANGLKNQTVGLLQAVSYLKVPLIAVDVLVIVVELLFGG